MDATGLISWDQKPVLFIYLQSLVLNEYKENTLTILTVMLTYQD